MTRNEEMKIEELQRQTKIILRRLEALRRAVMAEAPTSPDRTTLDRAFVDALRDEDGELISITDDPSAALLDNPRNLAGWRPDPHPADQCVKCRRDLRSERTRYGLPGQFTCPACYWEGETASLRAEVVRLTRRLKQVGFDP